MYRLTQVPSKTHCSTNSLQRHLRDAHVLAWHLRHEKYVGLGEVLTSCCGRWSLTSSFTQYRYVSLYRTPLNRNTRYTGRFSGDGIVFRNWIVLRLTGIHDKPDTFATPDQSGLTRHTCTCSREYCNALWYRCHPDNWSILLSIHSVSQVKGSS